MSQIKTDLFIILFVLVINSIIYNFYSSAP